MANYSYLSDGTKLASVNSSGAGYVYRGSLVYRQEGSALTLESAAFGGSRFLATSGSTTPNYFVADHLGSTRVILDAAGNIAGQSDYYPFGKKHDNAALMAAVNRYGYNGKEEQRFANVPYSDYGARMYDADVLPWISMDPLLEDYRPLTPYMFCAGNPVKFVDRDGREFGNFINDKGQLLGTDGIDDGKLYVLKTTETSFGKDGNTVAGAGLSRKDAKATADFIRTNSGNSEVFSKNSIGYDNSIEIEGSAANRQAMVSEVSKDRGTGGTKEANNREYGGSIESGGVKIAAPGDVANPQTDISVSIMLPMGVSTFHSHPSGYVVTRDGATITTHAFGQPPSPLDVSTAGANTHYVFGRGDKMVYIYNSAGVQATIPMNKFVNPK